MIIGVDASKIAENKKTGIDNTAYQIIFNLQKIDKKNNYILYTNKPIDKNFFANKNFKEKLISFRKFWHKFRLPLAIFKDRPDIFLELTSSIPPLAPEKSIVLIHDLAFKFFPEAYSKYENFIQNNAVEIALKKASLIILTSNANLNDFQHFYKFPKEKIRIVPLAFDDKVYKKINNPKVDIAKNCPYFLSVGRLEERKNQLKLIEAFEIFKKNDKKQTKLILVGKNGYGHEKIIQKINGNSLLKNNVIIAGYQNNSSLANLYSGAIAFVFPSLYEGFGLPVLEAMACQTPVLSSNAKTLKEVGDDACLYFDPKKPADIAKKMQKIITDEKLKKDLIKKGIKRVEQFSWRKTAEEFSKVIDELPQTKSMKKYDEIKKYEKV